MSEKESELIDKFIEYKEQNEEEYLYNLIDSIANEVISRDAENNDEVEE